MNRLYAVILFANKAKNAGIAPLRRVFLTQLASKRTSRNVQVISEQSLSAVYRKYRNNEVPEENLDRIQKAIEQQFEFFTIIPIAADVIEESKSLIRRYGKDYGLRTLDAMHIAGWNVIVEPDSVFVSSDKNQLHVVSLMNYQTIAI